MSNFVTRAEKTGLPAGEALEAFRLVKINSSGAVVYADAGDVWHAVTVAPAASGEITDLRLRNGAGTIKCTAAGAITAGATVYTQNDGKIDDSATADVVGVAISAAGANNDLIEVLPTHAPNLAINGPTLVVEAHTADDTLTAAESGSAHTNTGASGTVILTLPPAVPGLHYYGSVGAAQLLRFHPDGTDTMSLPATGVPGAAGKGIEANAVGESIHVACFKAGNWVSLGGQDNAGIWTAEA